MITVGSLFSGIGGIDLGLERCGMTVKWQSEIEPYSCRVLAKHWPDVPNLGNIREVNWEEVEKVNVIAGGYPCQPFSTAGKRGGSDDPRHLWPEMLRAISVLRPRVAFLENVRGHYSLGFDRVLGDLADIGYDAEWEIVSAQSVGAPHRRERLICLAYPSQQFLNGGGCGNGARTIREWSAVQESASGGGSDVADTQKQFGDGERDHSRDSARSETVRKLGDRGRSENVADTDGKRRGIGWLNNETRVIDGRSQERNVVAHADSRQTSGRLGSEPASRGHLSGRADHFGGEEGYAGGQWWKVEPDVGRVAHGIPARVDRLRGLGNAVVPQVAEVVGRVIMEMLTPI